MRTADPSVVSWQIALAKYRSEPVRRRHWWRELIVSNWRDANDAWEAQREAETSMYATEMEEFAEQFPRPTLKDFMVGLSQGSMAP